MKVLHVLPINGQVPEDPRNGPRSGLVQSSLAFAKETAARGHHVDVLGWSAGPARNHALGKRFVVSARPSWRWSRTGRWDVRWLAPSALYSMTHSTPDVLHVHADPNQLRLRGRVKILHLHSLLPATLSGSFLGLLGHADLVVCCSEAVRRQFLYACRWDTARTVVVNNGTDLKVFHPATPSERRQAREEFGVPDDAFTIAFLGAIVGDKGVLTLVHAVHRLRDTVPNALLLMAGGSRLWGNGGEDRQHVDAFEERVVAEAGSSALVFGLLPYATVPQFLRAADVLVLPSLGEGLPLSVLDASAAGIPVVASNVGGIPEIVEHDVTGLLVPPMDETALAEAMAQLASDPEKRRRMGTAGRERSLRFTWEHATDALERAYEQAREHRAARGRTSQGFSQ